MFECENWMPPRKSGLTSKTTKARVVRYENIQSSQLFLELTYSSSEASISSITRSLYKKDNLIGLLKLFKLVANFANLKQLD